MDEITKKFFSVSELAELYNISRQTVLYYDSNNLLKPSFRDFNGYRYYHFKEYTKLELILNLRKIGLSISQIKDYLNNPSTDDLHQILENQSNKYKKMILDAQTLLNDITQLQKNISNISESGLHQIFFKEFPEKQFYRGPLSSKTMGIKQRMLSLGKSTLPFYQTSHFKYFFNKWVISKKDYQAGKANTNRFYCIPADFPIGKAEKNIFKMPAGLYLCYKFKGLYQPQSQEICNKINQYLKNHNLTLFSPILISAQKNFWLTSKTEEYISLLQTCIKLK